MSPSPWWPDALELVSIRGEAKMLVRYGDERLKALRAHFEAEHGRPPSERELATWRDAALALAESIHFAQTRARPRPAKTKLDLDTPVPLRLREPEPDPEWMEPPKA